MTEAKTAIAEATAEAVTVRGHDLTSELMGHVSLTELFFLLLMGRVPDERERRMTDACLVAIAEHGLVPSVQAARMTLSAAPESRRPVLRPGRAARRGPRAAGRGGGGGGAGGGGGGGGGGGVVGGCS